MPLVEIQFGSGGTKIRRRFDFAPRRGDIVQIVHDEQEFALLIDTVLHYEDEADDGPAMRLYAHGRIIIDLDAELERQAELLPGR